MNDTLLLLRDTLLAQRHEPELIPLPAGIFAQTDRQLADLKTCWQATGDDIVKDTHEAIVLAREDLQEERAERIWAMAYTQADASPAMTESEKDLFEMLRSMAARLRGIE